MFGSVARNEATAQSDVDVLVDFDGPATFDAFMGLKLLLEDTLRTRVDLVTRAALKPRLRPASRPSAGGSREFRDVLIHDYFGVDVDIVCDVAFVKLPAVREERGGFRDEWIDVAHALGASC